MIRKTCSHVRCHARVISPPVKAASEDVNETLCSGHAAKHSNWFATEELEGSPAWSVSTDESDNWGFPEHRQLEPCRAVDTATRESEPGVMSPGFAQGLVEWPALGVGDRQDEQVLLARASGCSSRRTSLFEFLQIAFDQTRDRSARCRAEPPLDINAAHS